MTYKLLVSSFHHPDPVNPYRGLFNRRTLKSLASHQDCSITVFSPVPYAPPIGPKSEYWNIPEYESFSNYNVIRPRFAYLIPKSLFYAVTGELYKRTIRQATKKVDADVLHACHVYPDGYGLSAVATDQELPLTVTCHGHFLNNFSDLPPGVASHVRNTLECADHVFCVSDALKTKANKIASGTNISTVPIGAEPSKFPVERANKLRDAYSIPSDTAIVLFCGQFIERKGIHDIIESFDEFPAKNVEYVFIGHAGDLLEDLITVADSTATPHNVRVLSEVDTSTLREWYSMSDVLLLPSYAEGRPTVIYEAMAASTAVLSTRIEGVSEQVIDGETGLLIEPGNQPALVDALTELVENPEKTNQMGDHGVQRLVSQGWTWSDHANRVINHHQSIIHS